MVIPNEVQHYVISMQEIIKNDKQGNKDIYENEFVNPLVFWEFFEVKSMMNFAEKGDPVLSTDQFKEVHLLAMKSSLEKTMNSLSERGIIDKDSEGNYTITKQK